MKKRLSFLLVFLFVLGDLFFLNLSIILSYHSWDGPSLELDLSNRIYLFIFSNIAWFFLMLTTNPYRISQATQFKLIFRSHFSFIFIHLLTVISLVFFFDKNYTTSQIIFLYGFFIPVVFLWRLLFFYFIRTIRNQGSSRVQYIIVGQGVLAQDIRRNFRFHPEYGYKFLGYFNESPAQQDVKPFDKIQSFCLENKVLEIYCCLPDISHLELKKLIDFGLNHFIKVKLVSDNRAFYQKGIQLERFGQIPVLNAAAISLDETINQVIKRIFDLCFTIILFFTVLIWLMPLLIILIKLDSKGPAIYKQLRAGKRNHPFKCLKFRTMVLDDDAEFVQATLNDPRVTRLGKLLRKTSLDEFPQFINVLKGEMSVVGPRPHPFKLNDDFAQKLRQLNSRHYVKPGVTGLAQCRGYRGETKNILEMKHRIVLDRFYVENWSLLFDIEIIFKTVLSLLKASEKAF